MASFVRIVTRLILSIVESEVSLWFVWKPFHQQISYNIVLHRLFTPDYYLYWKAFVITNNISLCFQWHVATVFGGQNKLFHKWPLSVYFLNVLLYHSHLKMLLNLVVLSSFFPSCWIFISLVFCCCSSGSFSSLLPSISDWAEFLPQGTHHANRNNQ